MYRKILFYLVLDYQIHQVVHDIHMMLQWMALLMCVQSWCLHDTEVKEVKECVNKLSLKLLIIESQLLDTKVREFWFWINEVINHVIILKDPSSLEKACYSKCHVFSSSIGILATPILIPKRNLHTNWALVVHPGKKERSVKQEDLPSSPVFCPHFGTFWIVWLKVIAVEPIACVYL